MPSASVNRTKLNSGQAGVQGLGGGARSWSSQFHTGVPDFLRACTTDNTRNPRWIISLSPCIWREREIHLVQSIMGSPPKQRYFWKTANVKFKLNRCEAQVGRKSLSISSSFGLISCAWLHWLCIEELARGLPTYALGVFGLV